MKSDTTHSTFAQPEAETAVYLFDDWFDPIETCVRDRVREFIQAMIQGELDATLLRPRYGRLAKHAAADKDVPSRSEAHTSELQSHVNLVCRLLLETKQS